MAKDNSRAIIGSTGRLIKLVIGFISRRGFVSLMVVASLALSAASFFNTYVGMTEYMGYPVITAMMAFGLQGIMFAMSWIISQWLGTGNTKVILMLGAFTVCAMVSIGFSFSALFNFIYTEDMRVQNNEMELRQFSQQIIDDLGAQQAEKINEKHAKLIGSDDFKAWNADLQEISVIAQSVPQILSERIRATSQKKGLEVSQLSEEVAKTATELAQNVALVATLNSQIEGLNGTLAEARVAVSNLRQERNKLLATVNKLESEMEAEAGGVGSAPGEGPKYKAFKEQRDAAFRELSLKEIELQAEEARLADLETEVGDAQAKLATASAAQARLGSSVQQNEARLAEVTIAPTGSTATSATLDPVAAMKAISDGLQSAQKSAGFGAAISTVIQNCENLRNEMLSLPDIAPRLEDLECRSASFQTAANEVSAMDDRLAAFQEQCNSAQPATDASPVERFKSAVLKLENCLSASGLEAANYRRDLATQVASRGPDAHPFVVAQTALFYDRLPLAYMALFLAVAIDVLVLVAALLAGFVGQSRREKALRALRVLTLENVDGQMMPVVTLDPKDGLYRAIKEEATVLQFLGHGILVSDGAGENARERLVLFQPAFDYIAQQIAMESSLDLPAPTMRTQTPTPRSFP